tara:strand:+ start:898 stop:1665 length:768 start_codon:yes stop_codon:yes gene_type:complete
MLKILANLLIPLTLLSTSCVTVSCNLPAAGVGTLSDVAPRQSFLKIEKVLNVQSCNPQNPKQCEDSTLKSSGSGFVVANDGNGSYIMTAAHVCDDSDVVLMLQMRGYKLLSQAFQVLDIDGYRYNAVTLEMHHELDMCMAYIPGLFKPSVKVAQNKPIPGDYAINVAAPVGFFGEDMIPILTGNYSGDIDGRSIYTIPAIGGSSGSPVFNNRGYLIGMIHSVHIRFEHLAISPRWGEIVKFVQKYTRMALKQKQG